MGDVLSLVACSGSKRDERCVSYALYDSTLFEKSFGAACMVGDPYIMSAKHGIVSVDDRLDPYDKTLKNYTTDEKQEWARSLDIPDGYDSIVLFGGRDYVKPIIEVYGNEYSIVDAYDDCRGIGEQLSLAGEIIDNGGEI